jgi:hopene-associated glycosyltransferase HpnB
MAATILIATFPTGTVMAGTVLGGTILAGITAAIWLYLFFFRGQFWRLGNFDDDRARFPGPQIFPRVHAIVPARNEAETIAAAVTSLLSQNYNGHFSVTLVDDHSEDQTAQLAEQAAKSSGTTNADYLEERRGRGPLHNFSTISAEPLQPGWTGKLWALNQGVTKSLETNSPPDYFWFTDADITHAPDTLARLIARAETEQLDLTSLMVLLKSESLAEKFLIPPFLYFFLQLYPPSWIASKNSRAAGAAGGCILIRASALKKIGGLASIRQAVIDDCALAAAVKKFGGRLWMGVTRRSLSLRSYKSLAEIRDMIARTAFTQLRYSAPILLATLAALLITYIAPVALLFAPSTISRVLAAFASLLMLITFLPAVRYYRQSPLWVFTLPAVALFYAYATLLSAVRYWTGRGGQWKGRAQAPRNL